MLGLSFPACVTVALGPWLPHGWLQNEKLTVHWHLCIWGHRRAAVSIGEGHRAREGTQASSRSALLLTQCLGGQTHRVDT